MKDTPQQENWSSAKAEKAEKEKYLLMLRIANQHDDWYEYHCQGE